jgi:hypothetical protein
LPPKDASGFQEGARAFELMTKLVTTYWEALRAGGSDAKARNIFGEAYASGESKSVESNKRARQLRTFQFVGRGLEMMAHLKIGVKSSVSWTWGLHFH